MNGYKPVEGSEEYKMEADAAKPSVKQQELIEKRLKARFEKVPGLEMQKG